MTSEKVDWKEIAAILHDALPQFDEMLSEANVPIADRSNRAFELIRATMIKTPDDEAFLVSEVHGRFRIIVDDWYEDRYGKVDEGDQNSFGSVVMLHGTPFGLRVPINFRTKADEPKMIWIGFPDSVQPEEDPLRWASCADAIKKLPRNQQDDLLAEVTETANLVRSINFDLRSLVHDSDQDVSDLAGAIGSDLRSSARHLCERNEAGLRSAGWDASQATEKAIKIFIRRKGQVPPFTHDLENLAVRAEALGAPTIDRSSLAAIPSSHDATGMRYGGQFKLASALAAYKAALAISRVLLFAAKPDSKYNVRQARFKIQQPPWFEFDVEGFREELKSARDF